MRRFHVPPSSWTPDSISLPPLQAHHASLVLRLAPQDIVQIFDGHGHQVKARVVSLSAHSGVLEPIEPVEECLEPLSLVLGQGMPRGDKLEQVLQHGTELGLSRLFPIVLERSVKRPEPAQAASRRVRWTRIAEEAAKQCRRATVPEVEPVAGLDLFLDAFQQTNALGLVLYEQAGDGHLSLDQALERAGDAGAVWLLIGPEGGLTAAEVAQAEQAGMMTIGLGPRILRTETASLAMLAILQHRCGNLR